MKINTLHLPTQNKLKMILDHQIQKSMNMMMHMMFMAD